ncbi:MAG TPA: type II toxin-antitoxin system VapB family antitoxin [Pseudolysinimonas sp.]|nr:type II toxin-antitoxin system VapB family antitoxin [Pseudolysinimonas sp.]
MSLNIKNERTHALVRKLATLSGMSQTDAVTDAVERRLAELRAAPHDDGSARLARVLELAREIRESFGPDGVPDIDAELYDPATGLPR